MNQLFVRLVASGTFVIGLGATASADSAQIGLTGANSTNTITNRSLNSWHLTNLNRAEIGNWNNQKADSGNVWVSKNTNANGPVESGGAANSNQAYNQVSFANDDSAPVWLGQASGGSSAVITNTGANSNNQIYENSINRFNQTNFNNVAAENDNNQAARSGNVEVADNTNVGGPVESGNVSNQNSTDNSFDIVSPSPDVSFDSSDPGAFQISDTGYGSNNQISSSSNNNFRSVNENQVTIVNDNQQTAHSGNVNVVGNTNVGGPISSGNANNTNSTSNMLNINN